MIFKLIEKIINYLANLVLPNIPEEIPDQEVTILDNVEETLVSPEIILIPDENKSELYLQIEKFLKVNYTDRNKYINGIFTCGDFSRKLALDAYNADLPIGNIIVGIHPTFIGHDNHIMNYFEDKDEIVIIEPQTDKMYLLSQSMYKYYKLYPPYSVVPTYWKRLQATGEIK